MGDADRKETELTADDARPERGPGPLGGGHLQREAVAEQEREEEIELRLEEHRDGEPRRPVDSRVVCGIADAAAVVGTRERPDVDRQDPEQREPAERVDIEQAGASGRRCARHLSPPRRAGTE